MNSEIILIGPIGAGKTTIAEILYGRTMLPHRSMDLLRWKYFEEIGYDRAAASEEFSKGGLWGLYRYWKPFEAYAVKRLLEDFRECIFDFGSSQSVYEDERLFEQVRGILEPYSHVVLLLPSPDPDESINILHARNSYAAGDQWEVNEHFIRHHSNYDLAKFTAYTKGKTPEETAGEVLEWAKENGWAYETEV
jgi:hypothetical protein